MSNEKFPDKNPNHGDLYLRLQELEEKFLYQDRTIDDLNEVIIEQQAQLYALEEKFRRLQALLTAIEDQPSGVPDPRPPHY